MKFTKSFTSKLNTLAAQMRKHDKSLDRSQSMKAAYQILKNNPQAQLLVFTKTSGVIARRVVDSNWGEYYEVKGTGRKTPDHLRLFADLAKVWACKNPIISAVKSRIETLAA